MVKNTNGLLSPFPANLVRKAPAGKFGDYVPHAHYVERLRDSGVKYSWFCEPVYSTHNGEKRIVGAKGIITIHDGEHMGTYEGFGDIDTFKMNNDKFNDGTNLKDAESDAFKRACMRFGLGVELWSGSKQSEEEATSVAPDGYTQEMADADAKVEVTKVDMRRKENKPTKEDKQRMNDIMDDILNAEADLDEPNEAPF
jgi:recombination DNA repair RAD52 pathway protein